MNINEKIIINSFKSFDYWYQIQYKNALKYREFLENFLYLSKEEKKEFENLKKFTEKLDEKINQNWKFYKNNSWK